MRRRSVWLVAALVAAGVTIAVTAYSFSQYMLPNFSVVRSGVLWRSGQPNTLGLQIAHLAGIKTIVCLRSSDSAEQAAEVEFARRHGIEFIPMPLQFSGAGAGDVVADFIAVVGDPAHQPVLVHCARGKERSGVCSAAFRMEYDGWTNQQALDEMYDRGLKPGTLPQLEALIRDYRPRQGASVVATTAEDRLVPAAGPGQR